MLEFVKIILAKKIWSVVAIWSIFGPNLFGYQMAPIFVILFADLSFLPTSHTTQAQFCPVSTPIHIAMLPLPSSDQRRRPEKQKRV
jgi:hypothetical protein